MTVFLRQRSRIVCSYLGGVEWIDPYLLWMFTLLIAGLSLSVAPLVALHGIVSLSILFAIYAFFLAAPNALGNVIMIETVGMHRYGMAYGLSMLVSGSTSLFGYPLLGKDAFDLKKGRRRRERRLSFRFTSRSNAQLDDSICPRRYDYDFRWPDYWRIAPI